MTVSSSRIASILLLRVLPIAIAAVVAAIIGAGFWSYNLPELAQIARNEFRHSGADSVALSSVSITPWSGLHIDSLYLRGALSSEQTVEFYASRVRVKYHPIALLFEGKGLRKALEKAARTAHSPVVQREPFALLFELLQTPSVTRTIRGVNASDGWCRLTTRRKVSGEARDLNIRLDIANPDSAAADGEISAGTISLAGRSFLVRPAAMVHTERGLIELSKIKAFYCEGTVRASALLDMNSSRLLHADVKLSGMSLEKWYESLVPMSGSLTGKMNCTFNADTSRLSLDSIAGSGDLHIRGMVARDLPIQRSLILMLAIPQLSKLEFTSVNADYQIADGKFSTTNLAGIGDPMDINASGWVSMVDATFNDSVNCLLTKKFSRALPDIVRESLLPRDDGRRGFECTVSGTMANPTLVLNKEIMQRAVNNVFEKLGNELKGFFR